MKQSSCKMEPQRTSLTFCIFAAVIFSAYGLDFHWSATPSMNKQLKCSVDANSSTQDIFTFIDLTIFDVTNNRTAQKVAAVTVLDTDPQVDYVSESFLAVEGSISQHNADLVVTFSNQTYCSLCSYMCELNFISSNGHPVVIRSSTIKSTQTGSDDSHSNVSVGVANQMKAAVDRLTGITHDVEDRLTDRLALLEKKLDNITLLQEKLDNIALLEKKLDNIALLEKKLDNMAVLEEKLNNISVLEKKLDNITVLEKKLDNIALLEKKLDKIAVLEEKLEDTAVLGEKLDNITGLLTSASVENKGKNLIPGTALPKECKRGMDNVTSEPRILVKVLDNKPALCDTKTDGGGWIIIQRRTDGLENFYRPWKDYVSGFGDVEGGRDYWLGLQSIHELTSQENFELRVDLQKGGKDYYAQYASFYLGNMSSMYKLSIGDYSGNSGDSLKYHNNRRFSTYDRDNDDFSGGNCAVSYHGAWWFGYCRHSNLNGGWGKTRWVNVGDNLSMTEMKIRPTVN